MLRLSIHYLFHVILSNLQELVSNPLFIAEGTSRFDLDQGALGKHRFCSGAYFILYIWEVHIALLNKKWAYHSV